MYIVVSKWRTLSGKEQEFESAGRKMRNLMRSTPGVVMSKGFKNEDGDTVSLIGYESKNTWDKIVNDPNGTFVKGLQEHKLEEIAEWISAERGEAIED